ncbi:TPA: non-canonical purine NTP pyrophosphatase, RdgB/HAM1 family [Candidatus Uhrbacteria bacterium]|nr:non-canonical purine NTP pyrophosphatase, RdgB/HAM1 family [Candidatus Uhrbacteria bacterium]
MKLLIATRNAGKVKEMQHAFAGKRFELVSLDEAGIDKDFIVEETADTFVGNAELKARGYGDKAGMLTLAEDAGLMVDALSGRPGVLSARYVAGSDEDRYRHLLDELENVPDAERGAQFVAVIAIYNPVDGSFKTCEGICRGQILRDPLGTGGFGYDPVFYYPALDKTFGQLSASEKDAVSHRGIALKKAIEILV